MSILTNLVISSYDKDDKDRFVDPEWDVKTRRENNARAYETQRYLYQANLYTQRLLKRDEDNKLKKSDTKGCCFSFFGCCKKNQDNK
jgi:hypothetical protein